MLPGEEDSNLPSNVPRPSTSRGPLTITPTDDGDTPMGASLPAPQTIAPHSLFPFSVIFIAHSFIMGLAIGAFKDAMEIGLIGIIFIVMKIPISLAFGVMFLSAGRLCCKPVTIIFGFLFAAATPVGIGIMWAEEDIIYKSDPAICVIQGIVCGAIIYLACSNLLAREFQAANDINEFDRRDKKDREC